MKSLPTLKKKKEEALIGSHRLVKYKTAIESGREIQRNWSAIQKGKEKQRKCWARKQGQ
ncbi:MAG: hypothetical protein Ct9H300mP4_15000 [Gammaproteobacteria bacterium]|nr:MAG: hypothetical protein Ct9H300mP4_15000 [Gammaproteobacteria bacterium]